MIAVIYATCVLLLVCLYFLSNFCIWVCINNYSSAASFVYQYLFIILYVFIILWYDICWGSF